MERVPGGDWTDDMTETLRRLWVDPAISIEAIAAEIGSGVTAHAVIGKADRLKRAGRLPPVTRSSPIKPREQSLVKAAVSALRELDACLVFSADPRLRHIDGLAKAMASAKAVLDRADRQTAKAVERGRKIIAGSGGLGGGEKLAVNRDEAADG